MKAVILAGGKSIRAYPLTVNRPKSLLKVANKPIITTALSHLRGLVDEAVIVLGHEGQQLKEFLGDSYGNLKISYVEQKKQQGTADALLAAKKAVKGRFLLLMGDDLYSKGDIQKCLKYHYCVLVKEVDDVSSFGDVIIRQNYLHDIKEKPSGKKSGHASTGLYVLDEQIFKTCKKLRKSSRGEYELTDAVRAFARKEKIVVENAAFWVPVTYPWSILEANERLLDNIKGDVYATVEKNVIIKGKVIVGRGTLLRSGSYIEGPVVIGENCDIGPNCFIRSCTTIGNNCRIGNAVEVKNSVVMDNTKIGHLSYFGNSIAGENVNLGAGFIVANLRHDNTEVKSMIEGRLVSTGKKKFGTVIGDDVKTGINTSVYPGRKIWPGKTTLPGEVIRKDVK